MIEEIRPDRSNFRLHKLTDVEIKRIEQLIIQGLSVTAISREVGVSPASVSRVKRRMRVEEFKEVKVIEPKNVKASTYMEVGKVKIFFSNLQELISVTRELTKNVI